MNKLVLQILKNHRFEVLKLAERQSIKSGFGNPETLSMKMPRKLKKRLKVIARINKMSMVDVIVGWILKEDFFLQKKLKESLQVDGMPDGLSDEREVVESFRLSFPLDAALPEPDEM